MQAACQHFRPVLGGVYGAGLSNSASRAAFCLRSTSANGTGDESRVSATARIPMLRGQRAESLWNRHIFSSWLSLAADETV
jgi:hypothetical protein